MLVTFLLFAAISEIYIAWASGCLWYSTLPHFKSNSSLIITSVTFIRFAYFEPRFIEILVSKLYSLAGSFPPLMLLYTMRCRHQHFDLAYFRLIFMHSKHTLQKKTLHTAKFFFFSNFARSRKMPLPVRITDEL